MYEEYFGLERPPFKITPDTSLFYEGGKRGDILAALAYTIHRGEGIIKVVGEVGSGKTMLCRMLQLKLPDTVEIVYIANPSVSAEDILFVIAHELSLSVDKGASKHQVMQMLQDYLLQRHMENKQVVLFIEEAQGMPLDTLEEIRLLSNLETAENKLLQIILFGQPELDQNLAQRSIRQLRERITHNFELEPLTQGEIHNYLNFRMRQVGYTGPELISNTVAKKVEQHSAGLLRRINIIADKILLSAFAEGTHNLSVKHVTAAVNDSSFDQEAPRQSRLWWWLGPLLLLLLGAALYHTRPQWLALVPPGMLVSPMASVTSDMETTERTTESAVVSTTETPVSEVAVAEIAVVEPEPTAALSRSSVAVNAEPTALAFAEAPADVSLVASADSDSFENSEVQSPETDSAPTTTALAEAGEKADIESLSAQVDTLPTQAEVVVQQEQTEPSATPAIAQLQTDTQASVDPVVSTPADAPRDRTVPGLNADSQHWLNGKLEQSKAWLNRTDSDRMSIQIMMRSKTAARDLVYYLRNEWPLDISQTYMYEVEIEGRSIYRVLYSEFDALTQARVQIDEFPDSIKANSPYVLTIHQMRKALP
jgi:MSHA biogenesis protein MshM